MTVAHPLKGREGVKKPHPGSTGMTDLKRPISLFDKIG